MAELPELLELIAEAGVHSWQIQLTVAMGRAADEPDVPLQPAHFARAFPSWESSKSAVRARGPALAR